MLIVGSVALREHRLLPPYREIKDFDAIMTFPEFNEWTPPDGPEIQRKPISPKTFVVTTPGRLYDIEIAWPGTAAMALLEDERGLCPGGSENTVVASAEALLALKLSHRYLKNSPHFLKTMQDIHHLRSYGIVLTPWLKEWLPWRERETYTYKHPSLMKNKDGFFNGDGVPYKYDHDSLHVAVACGGPPVYTAYAAPGQEVLSSKELWDPMPRQLKIQAVWEECAVLALERSIIPHGTDHNVAFMMALEKVCTSITSGWFREFAWEAYEDVKWFHNLQRPTIPERLEFGIYTGTVKPYQPKEGM